MMKTNTTKKNELKKTEIPLKFFTDLLSVGMSNRPRGEILFAVCDYEFYGIQYRGKDKLVATMFQMWKTRYSARTARTCRKRQRAEAKVYRELAFLDQSKEEDEEAQEDE